jgi:20S proteasome subunit beta 2
MHPIKTGTTIVGVTYKSGVVLCADTRSTSGPVVADKNCEKIHFISPKIMCCGAGTAADTGRVTRMASKEMSLFSYKHMKDPYVSHCQRYICDYLFSYGGQIGAALVLGGIDISGPSLYAISPNGYSSKVDYTSLGSGSYAAISILESGFRKDLSKEEAIRLGCEAVKAGILNDLYSGSNVDVCIIDYSGVENLRNYLVVESPKNKTKVIYPNSSVEILREDIYKYIEEIN